jgi:hypothetical protein
MSSDLKSMIELNLNDNEFFDRGTQHISYAVSRMPTLLTLEMANNRMSSLGLQALAKAVGNH